MLIILLSKKIEFIGELTMEKEIVFVTHNTGKIKSAEKYFKNLKFGISLITFIFLIHLIMN